MTTRDEFIQALDATMNAPEQDHAEEAYTVVLEEYDALRAELAEAKAENAAYTMVVSSLNNVIDRIVHDGFDLMYSINNSITYDNEEEARKGGYGLPVHVIEEMHKFTQLLHDNYDAALTPPEVKHD